MLAEALPRCANPQVFYVLGGPGCGKGTQCEKLAEEFGISHFSAGDLLRGESKADTPTGRMVADFIKEGKIVPAQITIDLLRKAIDTRTAGLGGAGGGGADGGGGGGGGGGGNSAVLIDGFPRSMENLEMFESQVGAATAALFFECPMSELEARVMERGKTSGTSLSLSLSLSVCPQLFALN